MIDYNKIFKNHMGIQKKEDFVLPVRFSEEGLAFYEDPEAFLKLRAHCGAGIKMLFEMSGERFHFQYQVEGWARNSVYFDVYEDGQFIESLIEPDLSKSGKICYTKKGEGKVLVEIYLPHNCITYIKDLKIEGVSYVEDERPILLCLGDSITQGMDAKSPACTYPVQLERELGMRLVNQAIGGYTFNAESLLDVVRIGPACITVAYGTNDFNKIGDVCIIKQNVEAYMKRLKEVAGDAEVYILTPLWRSNNCETKVQKEKFMAVAELVREAAVQEAFEVIDGLKLISHDDRLFVDRLHPNEEGFDLISQNLLKLLK